MNGPVESQPNGFNQGWLSRERMFALLLMAATAIVLILCYLLIRPFMPALAWALALAVFSHPLHHALEGRVAGPSISAGITVLIVLVLLIGPMLLMTQQVLAETMKSIEWIRGVAATGDLREHLDQISPQIGRAWDYITHNWDLQAELQGLGGVLAEMATTAITGQIWGITQLLIGLYILYFFLRDHQTILRTLRALIPLSSTEADAVFQRVADTIHAAIYGVVVVSMVKGALGGLAFWVLGLPGALFWGMVMFVLSIFPLIGPFLVWIPAAILLAAWGKWISAIIMMIWGGIVVSFADNVLYPVLVGNRLRLHAVLVLLAFFGGILVFGASGIILGPVILALAVALAEIWGRRTAHGRTAEEGINQP